MALNPVPVRRFPWEADLERAAQLEQAQGVSPTGWNYGGTQPSRPGMFGRGGTLNRVLGGLGDALRGTAGLDPYHAPALQQRQQREAMAGFADDPLGAIERVRAINPAAAIEMQENLLKQENLRSQITNRDIGTRKTAQEVANAPLDRLAAMSQGINDEETYQARLPFMQREIDRLGGDVVLPSTFEEAKEMLLARRAASVPVNQQVDDQRQQEARQAQEAYRDAQLALREATSAASIARAQSNLEIATERLQIARERLDFDIDKDREQRERGSGSYRASTSTRLPPPTSLVNRANISPSTQQLIQGNVGGTSYRVVD